MYSLSIIVGPTVWALLFKTEESAEKTYKTIVKELNDDIFIVVKDDFGQKIGLRPESLHGYMLENLDETKLAHVEKALHTARTNMAIQRTAEQDPSLRARLTGGPSVLSPGFNGRMS